MEFGRMHRKLYVDTTNTPPTTQSTPFWKSTIGWICAFVHSAAAAVSYQKWEFNYNSPKSYQKWRFPQIKTFVNIKSSTYEEFEVGLGLSKVLKKVLKKVNLLKKVLKKVNLLKKALKKALKKVSLLKKALKKALKKVYLLKKRTQKRATTQKSELKKVYPLKKVNSRRAPKIEWNPKKVRLLKKVLKKVFSPESHDKSTQKSAQVEK